MSATVITVPRREPSLWSCAIPAVSRTVPVPQIVGEGVSSISSVVITVNANNDGPTASAGGAQNVEEGDSVTLDASGSSDPEGEDLTYAWEQLEEDVHRSDETAAPILRDAPRRFCVTMTIMTQDLVSTGADEHWR